MKNFTTLCIVSCLLIFSSCKNDESSSGSPSSTNEDTFLTATINGKQFSSSVKIVSFRANKQTHLTTSDNPDPSEFAFNLIIENNKDDDPTKMRYGFVEKEDDNGENKIWKLPNNFDFTSNVTTSGDYLEGTFSFIANSFDKGVENSNDQLIVENGKFRAATSLR